MGYHLALEFAEHGAPETCLVSWSFRGVPSKKMGKRGVS